jgi:hypothetical protein
MSHRVTSQKSEDLNYTATEARNLATKITCPYYKPHSYDPEYRSRYTDYSAGWTIDESRFNSHQR